MNNKQKLGVFALIAIGWGVWYYDKKRKEEEQEEDEDKGSFSIPPSMASTPISKPVTTPVTKPTPNSYTPPSGRFKCVNRGYPLAHGTCNSDVKIVQSYLKRTFKADLGRSGKNRDGVDGMFGNKTALAAHRHLGKVFFTKQDINSMRDTNKMILV